MIKISLMILVCIFLGCQKNEPNPFLGTYCVECRGAVKTIVGTDKFGDPIQDWVDTIYQMEIYIMNANESGDLCVSSSLVSIENCFPYYCNSGVEESICSKYHSPSASHRIRREIAFEDNLIYTESFSAFGSRINCNGHKK